MKTFKKVHLISAIVAMSALAFVACGDDDSASTYNIIESSDTNSDDIDDQGDDAKSSSSEKAVACSSSKVKSSSSSKKDSGKVSSSSSEKVASSSSKKEETAESSSSSEKAEPSSSAKEESAKSSSSSVNKNLADCGGTSYDKTEKFCKDKKIYDLCGGEEYDPSTEICKDKKVLIKCSDGSYDKATQFCKDGGVYDLCGGKEYSPVDEVCKEGIVASRYTFGYALKNAPRPSAGCGKNSSLVKTKTIENGERYEMMVEGLNREYFITLPKDYDKTKPYKLLFAMHSMGSNAEDFVHHFADQDLPSPYYGQQDLDKEGNYIFVALRGDTDGDVWRKNDGKDHAFFDKLLTTMENNYCIDTSRVFVTGFAFGALFTYSLAEGFQDRIRAIVTYAVADYNIYEPHENGMEKSLPIAWMNVHGKNDPIMLYEKAVESVLPRVLKKNGKASDGDSQFTDASGEKPAEVAEGESGHVCYDFTKVDERFPVKWCTWNGRSQWTAYDGASSSNGWMNTWVPEEVHKFLEQF